MTFIVCKDFLLKKKQKKKNVIISFCFKIFFSIFLLCLKTLSMCLFLITKTFEVMKNKENEKNRYLITRKTK